MSDVTKWEISFVRAKPILEPSCIKDNKCILFLKEALKCPVLNYYKFPVWAYLTPTILLAALIFHCIAAYIPLCVYQFQACVLCTFIWYFFKASDITYIQWSISCCKMIRRVVGQLVREEAELEECVNLLSTMCCFVMRPQSTGNT